MNSRHLAAVLMLLLIGMSCFLSTPVLSGEHPWDVDRTGGGNGSSSPQPIDSSRVENKSGSASIGQQVPNHDFGSWYGVISRLAIYFSMHQTATRSHGVDTKGKVER